ncbi:MAG: hypothetical protein ABIF85_00790 [Nanoarchaeota archaeon]
MSDEKKIVDNAKFVVVSVGINRKPTPIAQPSFANAEEKAEFEKHAKEREVLNTCKKENIKHV